MKKLFIIVCLILSTNIVFADTNELCDSSNQSKCLNALTLGYNNRAAVYNALNLSDDQIKCKEVIDAKRFSELKEILQQYKQEKYVLDKMCDASKSGLSKQKNVVKNIEKDINSINKKYDKEFKSILSSTQKSKLSMINKLERKELNNCKHNKKLYKQDSNLRPFGDKMYTNNVLCPVHEKWHIFGKKHIVEESK